MIRAEMRRGGMRSRAIAEFGKFMSSMRAYLTWEETPKRRDRGLSEFMKLLPVESFDTRNMLHYYVLYDLYDTWYGKEPDSFGELVELHEQKIQKEEGEN